MYALRPAGPAAEEGRGDSGFSSLRLRPHAEAPSVPRPATYVALGLLLLQLGLMVGFSTLQYQRFALTKDFAIYNQAWWSIAHGHLDPRSTILGLPFWRNNSEFIIWPLSLLQFIDPHPVVFLWVQDLLVVATEAVSLAWIRKVVFGSPLSRRGATALYIGSAAGLTFDPWAWQTIGFDFHSHVVAAFFTILLGYDLWSGRRRALVWVPLTLLCCAPAGLYVAGAGMAGTLTGGSRTERIRAAVVLACGVGWVAALGRLGGAGLGGQGVAEWYGYLANGHGGHPGLFSIGLGVLTHPAVVVRTLLRRLPTMIDFLAPVGLIGVLSPWGFCLAGAVLLPSALNANPLFFRFAQSFQTWPALPFVLVGTASVIVFAYSHRETWRRLWTAAVCIWGAMAVVLAATQLPSVTSWIAVTPRGARTLSSWKQSLPATAEVVVDNGVAGRFGARSDIRVAGFGPVPIDRRQVVFVFAPGEGVADPTTEQVTRAVRDLVRRGAVVQATGPGLVEVVWRPPSGTSPVDVP